ncbi:MAG TPA: glycerophosphodiester phosphodiesterase [Acidimicrobiales bacterium]
MNGKDFFAERKNKFGPLVIAHRGASAAAPENTVVAFTTAIAQGADGVELDVRRTGDGTLAVCHDPHLPDGRALLSLNGPDLPPDVPVLDVALDACRGVGVVNVEIKNWPGDIDHDATGAFASAVVEALVARPATERESFLVSCFDRPTLDLVRERAPALATGWLVIGVGDDEGAATVAEAAAHGHTAIHPHHSAITPGVVERAHDAGLAVNTWTCDHPDRIRRLAAAGVDGIVTNTPDVALAALGRDPAGG